MQIAPSIYTISLLFLSVLFLSLSLFASLPLSVGELTCVCPFSPPPVTQQILLLTLKPVTRPVIPAHSPLCL